MKICTECYIRTGGKTLMLYRNKKENDVNKNKWIGIGGKLEEGESPEDCLLREAYEEAGVRLTDYRLRGIVSFSTTEMGESYVIFIYTASGFEGEIGECDEGELRWIDDGKLMSLELWEGDRLFWGWIIEERPFFSAKLVYDGDKLVESAVQFY